MWVLDPEMHKFLTHGDPICWWQIRHWIILINLLACKFHCHLDCRVIWLLGPWFEVHIKLVHSRNYCCNTGWVLWKKKGRVFVCLKCVSSVCRWNETDIPRECLQDPWWSPIDHHQVHTLQLNILLKHMWVGSLCFLITFNSSMYRLFF